MPVEEGKGGGLRSFDFNGEKALSRAGSGAKEAGARSIPITHAENYRLDTATLLERARALRPSLIKTIGRGPIRAVFPLETRVADEEG